MTFNEYQEAAKKTDSCPKLLFQQEDGTIIPAPLAYHGLGLGEAGEAQNKIKKIFRDDNGVLTEERREAIRDELGGILWYVAMAGLNAGLTMDEIAVANVELLKDRAKRGVLKGSGDKR